MATVGVKGLMLLIPCHVVWWRHVRRRKSCRVSLKVEQTNSWTNSFRHLRKHRHRSILDRFDLAVFGFGSISVTDTTQSKGRIRERFQGLQIPHRQNPRVVHLYVIAGTRLYKLSK